MNEADVTVDLEKAVAQGLAERIIGTDGVVRYRLTEAGKRHVEEVLKGKEL